MSDYFSKRISTWAENFLTQNVQTLENADTGNFLSGESVVLFAGPPNFGDGAADLIPIGLVQSANVSQGKQVQQIFEIGSRLPFFVPGRTQIQFALSRVLFDGPSLMKAMYVVGDGTAAKLAHEVKSSELGEDPAAPFVVGDAPSTSGKFWINLASNYFNKPVGLGFAMYDMQQQAYAGFYLEGCFIRSHQFQISANDTVLAESLNGMATKMRPLDKSLVGTTPDSGPTEVGLT
jgi:hypothetical protein